MAPFAGNPDDPMWQTVDTSVFLPPGQQGSALQAGAATALAILVPAGGGLSRPSSSPVSSRHRAGVALPRSTDIVVARWAGRGALRVGEFAVPRRGTPPGIRFRSTPGAATVRSVDDVGLGGGAA